MDRQQPTATALPSGAGTDTSPVTQQAKELARTGSEQVKEITQSTRQRALRELDTKRMSFADEVEKLAGVLERHGNESDKTTPVLDIAASAARRLSTAMKDRSTEELLRGVTRNPMAVLAGSFALGFLTVRLFKA
jgi:hypothetical protein